MSAVQPSSKSGMHIGVVEVEVVLVVVLVEVGQRMSAPHSSDCKPPCGAQKATQTGCASEPLQVSEHKLKDELSIQLHTNKAPPSGGTHKPTLPEQRPLQQSVLVQKVLPPAQVQDPPFGWHIGVVDVEVVLVDVDVEVVGVVVEVLVEVVLVDVEVVGVVVLVDVEVVGVVVDVLVEVLVVLLVDVLVVVVVLLWQLPMVSPGCCSRWRLAAASPTVIV
jgi:hypothetical protein